MAKAVFSPAQKDVSMEKLAAKCDQKSLAIWAYSCVERVMPFFEEANPEDSRPRQALVTLQAWLDSGEIEMAVVRKSALESHAAAREVGQEIAARSAARAAGQAVATAHAPGHALAAAKYSLQAIQRASDPVEAAKAMSNERDWQVRQLIKLVEG